MHAQFTDELATDKLRFECHLHYSQPSQAPHSAPLPSSHALAHLVPTTLLAALLLLLLLLLLDNNIMTLRFAEMSKGSLMPLVV